MRRLIVILLLFSACHKAKGACFVPTDQTAGWKQARVPDAAPGLAAPSEIQQFRSGEAAMVWESDTQAYQGAIKPFPGRAEYVFSLPSADVRLLEVEFVYPLD